MSLLLLNLDGLPVLGTVPMHVGYVLAATRWIANGAGRCRWALVGLVFAAQAIVAAGLRHNHVRTLLFARIGRVAVAGRVLHRPTEHALGTWFGAVGSPALRFAVFRITAGRGVGRSGTT